MVSRMAYTVLYYECKASHGEELELQGRLEYTKVIWATPLIDGRCSFDEEELSNFLGKEVKQQDRRLEFCIIYIRYTKVNSVTPLIDADAV
ncbi:hypothetical protein M0R45_019230 [Rubus argutus]|uniref:Uncharacterized protein n=1 Tax=Rubus argutus TaxID=59490 RepID=A0AAW1X5L8_RUBAR